MSLVLALLSDASRLECFSSQSTDGKYTETERAVNVAVVDMVRVGDWLEHCGNLHGSEGQSSEIA